MVTKASHTGLRDWLAQRITAVIIGIYALYISIYLLVNQPLYYAQWKNLFHLVGVRIATLVVLIAILWHAWLGLWIVMTDYIKSIGLRILLQSLVIILLVAYVIWGIEILWG